MRKRKAGTGKKNIARRRYSPREQQIIQELAEGLGKLVPATSRGPFSLQQLAKERGLGAYFDSKLGSKKKQFSEFITRVHRARPRTLRPFVADMLAPAVERRRTQGNPVLRPEIDALKEKLLEFGIDLRAEIDSLNLPTNRPNITPPPMVTLSALEAIGLHPSLKDQVLVLFKEGHINEAVRKGAEIFETMIRRGTGIQQYGRPLMAKVFDKDAPVLDIAGYHGSQTSNAMDEKEGYLLMSMGVMQWCKNVVGHDDIPQLQPHDGASRIAMISHLMEVAQVAIDKPVS